MQQEGDADNTTVSLYTMLRTDQLTTLDAVKNNPALRRACAMAIPRVLARWAQLDNCEDYADICSVMSVFAAECSPDPEELTALFVNKEQFALDKKNCRATRDKDGFWLGPYDMHVDNSIDAVPSPDGINRVYRDFGSTEMKSRGVWVSKEVYLANYAHKRPGDDRFWFWPKSLEKHPCLPQT